MAKKHEEEKEPNHERWLLTYADLITLLMIFFVVMYSMSVVDAKKFKQIAQALNTVFSGGAGILQGSGTSPVGSQESGSESGQDQGASSSQGVTIERRQNEVRLILDERVLFSPGSASFTLESNTQLIALSKLLRRTKGTVRVEGHTDNLPPGKGPFRSNWQLSSTRAANIAEFLSSSGVDSRRILAVGLADSRPKASNATPEGRAMNRRVVIVVNSLEDR
ncbi:MAG: OmpA family protein [Deltaproteobacteria bacterium]|nr:OmpA family protein [Deltaproteobacteria bacterium]